jgi:hypothetical protein
MQILLNLLAVAGLAFLIKQSDGPWGLMAWIRNVLMRNKYVGIFFYKLFDCFFCCGCHAGYIIYLLSTHYSNWTINYFIIWSLAGGIFSLFFNNLINKINS